MRLPLTGQDSEYGNFQCRSYDCLMIGSIKGNAIDRAREIFQSGQDWRRELKLCESFMQGRE